MTRTAPHGLRLAPRLLPVPLLLLLALLAAGCSPYYANLARSFGGVVGSPSADLAPMLRGLTSLCRRQADLAYLRARLEAPADARVMWQERSKPRYNAQKEDYDKRCSDLEKQVQKYQLMHATLLSYGASLRALADSETVDMRAQFSILGNSMGTLARQLDPADAELTQVLQSGATAINELLRLALAARSEADIKETILRAELPVDRLLNRLQRAVAEYTERVEFFVEAQRRLTARLELSTRPGTARPLDVLAFYVLAQRLDEEEERLLSSARLYKSALASLRGAHTTMVKTARGGIPAKQAVLLVQQNFRNLFLELSEAMYNVQSIYLRRLGP